MIGVSRAVLMAAANLGGGGIEGVLEGPPVEIDTSMVATATAYSNQRKVDCCQNGVLWSMFWNGVYDFGLNPGYEFWYSVDNGATWNNSGTHFGFFNNSQSYTPNASFFIDVDDYAHVVFKDAGNGSIYYRRGTPNAARTAWTWSSATAYASDSLADYPDIIAHREGTGWKAHIVLSYVSGSNNYAYYGRIGITSGGTISVEAGPFLTLGGSHANSNHTWPSIDFNHTGDGKTVAGGTPHLYAAWSAGDAGAGKGIRFKKATYSGGSWTWGTEREIDSTRSVSSFTYTWLNCLFDGTRIIIAGLVLLPATSKYDLMLYERDAADTTTTTTVLFADGGANGYTLSGSATYDAEGNLYLFGVTTAGAPYELVYRKWVRSTDTLEPKVVIDAAAGSYSQPSTCTVKRGYSNSKIEFIYTDETASPYSIKYGALI